MNVFLWVLQGLLAAAFLVAGTLKATQSKDRLAPKLPWVADFSAGTVKFIGATQVAGALGLVLPGLTGIAVLLTPLAAVGLALTMLLAAVYHLRKGEYAEIKPNVVIFVVAAFIAWARFGPFPL